MQQYVLALITVVNTYQKSNKIILPLRLELNESGCVLNQSNLSANSGTANYFRGLISPLI